VHGETGECGGEPVGVVDPDIGGGHGEQRLDQLREAFVVLDQKDSDGHLERGVTRNGGHDHESVSWNCPTAGVALIIG
jgi:hypothetical protein